MIIGSIALAADHLAKWSGLGKAPFVAEDILALALKRSGRGRFGDQSFVTPLRNLLSAYDNEANLSIVGRLAARWDTLRSLGNLLRFDQEEERAPQIVQADIENPIFITGLPRSGTTFLHTLLSQDSNNRVPLVWQAIYPYPLQGGSDIRVEKVEKLLRSFLRLVPELRNLHPLSAVTPQECMDLTAQVFQSPRYSFTHSVPSYQTWLENAGQLEAYRFHKRFLQHLQYQSGAKRWILKSPEHIFSLDSVLQVYPDARFLFTHRDPRHVIASIAKLTELLRRPFCRVIDKRQIGRKAIEHWTHGANLLLEASDQSRLRDRIFHVDFHRLIRDPVGTVDAVYHKFGLEFTDETRLRISDSVAHTPRGGYGNNKYSGEEFGLNPDEIEHHFHDYMIHFDIKKDIFSCALGHGTVYAQSQAQV